MREAGTPEGEPAAKKKSEAVTPEGQPAADKKSEAGLPEESQMTDKATKAFHKLESIRKEVDEILDQLCQIREKLATFLDCKKELKKLDLLEGLPERIEFTFNRIKFYIDFTITMDESSNLNGYLIYGVSKRLCF